jgi:purine-binding chemotaxis protein CheW
MNPSTPMIESKARTFCAFRVQGRLYGIETRYVREVGTHTEVTSVPQAPPIIRGLANLRSRIFLVLDLRAALGLKPAASAAENRLIVLQDSVMEQAGVLVDGGGEIIRVLEDQIEDAPRGPMGAGEPPEERSTELVVGVCKLENELMMIVDPARLVEAAESAIR